jgi:hypothetical protein
VGKTRWPGDLWGIDSQGDLILIECKKALPANPFEDFIAFHKQDRPEIFSADLSNRWEEHYHDELSFPNSWEERPQGKTDGLLPRSNKRRHIRRWKHLAESIYAYLKSEEYIDAVKKYMTIRAKRNNPIPYYAGLLVSDHPVSSLLNQKGLRAFGELKQTVGPDHVKLYLADAEISGIRQVEITITDKEVPATNTDNSCGKEPSQLPSENKN